MFRFTASVAEFAEILKKSYWAKDSNLADVNIVAKSAVEDMQNKTDLDDFDEFSQACIATIYVLDFLSRGTFDHELLKDSTILLNDLYLFSYAVAKKKAHEFQKARHSACECSPLAGNQLVA